MSKHPIPRFTLFTLLLIFFVAGAAQAQPGVFQPPANRRIVALTFDDGPRASSTPRILEILAREKVKATFFVVGRKAAELPFLIRREHREGHYVENHSYYHNNLTKLSRENKLLEWRLCNDIVEGLTGHRPTFGRPPGGQMDDEVIRSANRAGLTVALWTLNTSDYTGRPASEILETVKQQLRPGTIVLLHDALPNTIEALPGIIRLIRSRGYDIVPLEEMGS